jgi:general secretion pathway protein C
MNAASWLDGLSTHANWRSMLQSRGPQIAVWTLSLLLGVQGATTVTRLAGAGRTAPVATATTAPAAQQRLDVAGIANSHLFGAPPVAAAGVDASNAPRSSAPLVLTGIIAASDPKDGMAIVGESAAAAKVYAVGDNLPGGARVHSVYEDRVLIERGGAIESLVLPHQYTGAMAAQPLPVAANVEAADRVRRAITEQPAALADIMRPQPVFAEGKQRGYRIYPGRNRQAFLRLGLRPGDLVLAINGTPLDDPARGQEIFNTLGSASEAHVTVMRNGRQQDVPLNMTQLATEADQLNNPGPAAADTPPAPPPVEAPNGSND